MRKISLNLNIIFIQNEHFSGSNNLISGSQLHFNKNRMDILNYLRTWKDTKKGNYLILALVIIFLALSAVVYFLPTSVVDIEFSEEVQEHINPTLNFIMKAVSWFGRTWISVTMVAVVALSFLLASYKKEALFVLLTLLVSPINTGIKLLISRPRPTADLVTIVQVAQHQSFPSGHVSFYVVFFGFLVFLMLRHHSIAKFIRYIVIIFSLLLNYCLYPFHGFTLACTGLLM